MRRDALGGAGRPYPGDGARHVAGVVGPFPGSVVVRHVQSLLTEVAIAGGLLWVRRPEVRGGPRGQPRGLVHPRHTGGLHTHLAGSEIDLFDFYLF